MTGRRPTGPTIACAILLALVAGTACTSYRTESVPLPQVLVEREPRSILVVLRSSREIELFDPVLTGDSVRGNITSASVQRRSVAVADISTVATRRFNLGKSLLMVAGGVGIVITYELLMRLNERPF